MRRKISKELILNIISAALLTGLLLYLYKSLGELATAFLLIPFVLLYLSEGGYPALVAMGLSFGIATIFMDPASLIYLAVYTLLGSLFLCHSLQADKGLRRTVLQLAFIKLGCLLAFLGIAFYFSGQNPIESMREYIDSIIKIIIKDFPTGIDISEDMVIEFEKGLRQAMDRFILLLPALAFIISYITSFINSYIIVKYFRDDPRVRPAYVKINRYHADNNLKYATAVLLGLSLVLKLAHYEHADIFISNAMAVLGFFYFANGFLLTDYIFEISGNKFLRFTLPIFMVFFWGNIMFYQIIGGFDLFFNIRRKVSLYGKKGK